MCTSIGSRDPGRAGCPAGSPIPESGIPESPWIPGSGQVDMIPPRWIIHGQIGQMRDPEHSTRACPPPRMVINGY